MKADPTLLKLLRKAVRDDRVAVVEASRALVRRGVMQVPEHRIVRSVAFVQRRMSPGENIHGPRECPEEPPPELPEPTRARLVLMEPRSTYHALSGDVVQNTTNRTIRIDLARVAALQGNDNARARASVQPTPGQRRNWPPPIDAVMVECRDAMQEAARNPGARTLIPAVPEEGVVEIENAFTGQIERYVGGVRVRPEEPEPPPVAPLTANLFDLELHPPEHVNLFFNGALQLYGSGHDWRLGEHPEEGDIKFNFAAGPLFEGGPQDVLQMTRIESGLDFGSSMVRSILLYTIQKNWPEIIADVAAEETY